MVQNELQFRTNYEHCKLNHASIYYRIYAEIRVIRVTGSTCVGIGNQFQGKDL